MFVRAVTPGLADGAAGSGTAGSGSAGLRWLVGWSGVTAVAAAVVGFSLWLWVGDVSARTTTVVVDLVETVVPLLAAAACLLTARSRRQRGRRAWLLVGASLGFWGAGQGVWSWYEVVARVDAPFPSFADAGYLLFPVFAGAGLLVYARGSLGLSAGRRAFIDGALVGVSLLTVSWLTVLGAVYRAGDGSFLATAVSVAYPIADVVLLTLVLHILSRVAGVPRPLVLLAGGLAVMTCADGLFAYLVASGSYHTGGPSDVGWIVAFILIGFAARCDRQDSAPTTKAAVLPTRVRLLLPYLPFTVGSVGLAAHATGAVLGPAEISFAGMLLGLVLLRQLLTLLDNASLLGVLRAREAELAHLAFHDPLTGLANRALFTDRVLQAAAQRDTRPLTALFLDLDDFKPVNDTHGHPAGDQLLTEVAVRLRASTRPGDTVARLGGDEFAILLSSDGAGADVAQRILDTLGHPIRLDQAVVTVTASIGVAEVPSGGNPEQTAERLLREADNAMYAAKTAGKHRYSYSRPAAPNRSNGPTEIRLSDKPAPL